MQLESLYQQHAPDILHYLRRLARDPAEAEDLLQETFLEAARHWEGVAAACSPRAWLFGIARNLSRGTRRRWRIWRTQPLPERLGAAASPAEDPRLESMRAAIGELSAPYREALELRLRHDLSYAEIAEVLSIPVGTVRSRLHEAVTQLRERLQPAAAVTGRSEEAI